MCPSGTGTCVGLQLYLCVRNAKCKLKGEAEAEVIIAVGRRIVVAISRTAIRSVVVITTAAIHAIRTGRKTQAHIFHIHDRRNFTDLA